MPNGAVFPLEVMVGFYADGRICEVFCTPTRTDAIIETVTDEACQLVSWLLQRGATLREIARAFGERQETSVAAVVKALVDFEEELDGG